MTITPNNIGASINEFRTYSVFLNHPLPLSVVRISYAVIITIISRISWTNGLQRVVPIVYTLYFTLPFYSKHSLLLSKEI